MEETRTLLMELDQLKSVIRKSWITTTERRENSAEHSWHLAVALLVFREIIPQTVNLDHAIRMALLHDVCEIGVGDVSVYDASRDEKTKEEAVFMDTFAKANGAFGEDAMALWEEYEAQATPESLWVKIVDRLLPFMLGLATEGRTWQEMGIRRSQVLGLNRTICDITPEIYQWMEGEIDKATAKGWLVDG